MRSTLRIGWQALSCGEVQPESTIDLWPTTKTSPAARLACRHRPPETNHRLSKFEHVQMSPVLVSFPN